MRCHGRIDRAAGLGADAHGFWAYEDAAGLSTAACEFLGEGLDFGQRLLFVAEGSPEQLRHHLEGLPRAAELEREGTLLLRDISQMYGAETPEERLAAYADATAEARAAGYTGLRVVSDVTALLGDPATWEDFARLEAMGDRFMATDPLSALCCVDRRRLPDALVGDLARLHPCANHEDDLGRFRIFAAGDGAGMVLDGEVDAFGRDAFNRLLDHAIPEGEESTLDLAAVGFIDHSGVLALVNRAEAVAAAGGSLTVTGVPYGVSRVCEVLGVRLPAG